MSEEQIIERGPFLRAKLIRDELADSNPEDNDIPVYLVHFHRQFEHCDKRAPVQSIDDLRNWFRTKPVFDEAKARRTYMISLPARYAEASGNVLEERAAMPGVYDVIDSEGRFVSDYSDEMAREYLNLDREDEGSDEEDYVERLRERYEDDLDDWNRFDRDEWVSYLVSAYIHGGVSLSLLGSARDASYPDRQWDVSVVGAVFIKKEGWGENMDDEGYSYTYKDETHRIKWEDVATTHVDQWNSYNAGDVWGVTIERANAADGDAVDWEDSEVDSCWGFIGEEHALTHANEQLDYYAKKDDCVHEPDWEEAMLIQRFDEAPVVHAPCAKCSEIGTFKVSVKGMEWTS